MERGHGLAERRVGGLKHMVHLGREPRRNIPIVSLREHMVAALEPHAAIAEPFVWLDVQRGAHFGACRLVRVPYPLGDDARRIGPPGIGAPAFDREGCAVMGEEIGVEALDERKRFEPAGEAVGPGPRLGSRRDGRREQQGESSRQTSLRRLLHICSASAVSSNHVASVAVKARSSSARFTASSAILASSPLRALACVRASSTRRRRSWNRLILSSSAAISRLIGWGSRLGLAAAAAWVSRFSLCCGRSAPPSTNRL